MTGTTAPNGGTGTTGTTNTGSSTSTGSTQTPPPAGQANGDTTSKDGSGTSGSGNTSSGAQPPSSGGTSQADATQARFNRPMGIARDSSGNLYIADSGNNTIRKKTPTGVVTTLAGSPGASGSADGTGAAARFSALRGITVDGAGNVYAVDNSAVRKISPAGVVTTLAGASGELGDADGPGATARFRRPWGVAVDGSGNVYVADTENSLVRRISTDGTVSTYAGTRGMRGRADGTATTATFLGPVGIATDPAGNVYLTDWFGPPAPNIPEGSTFVRRIATDGTVSTLAGTLNGETAPGLFMDTFAIVADSSGNVFVAALGTVRRVSATGTVTVVASSSVPFTSINGITIDESGNLYVTDVSNHTVSRVTQSGEITVIAGKTGEAGSADTP
jgi:sugar lactone lactonase YvrE